MIRNAAAISTALVCAVTPASFANAARISPMVVVLAPSGSGATTRLELSNPDDKSFPVEIRMFRGDISEAGELSLTPADDDFLVFPTQLVVPAKAQQAIRLQYIGAPDLKQSEIYYAAVRQIPVEMPGDQSRVQVVVNFNVLVNVVPPGAKADPKVEVVGTAIRENVPGVEVRVSNAGNRFTTAGTLPWQVTGTATDGLAVDLRPSAQEMAKAIGVGVVAPGKSRLFFVPTGKPLTAGTVRVSLAR